jgi:CheY-like chemotaxis protein
MNKTVLLVDDEPRALDAIRRNLHARYELTCVTSGAEALELVTAAADREPYAVLVSDMQMPGMDGATLLREAKAVSPDTVQIILSGHAELDSTITAVNQGRLFRFLTKPCDTDVLAGAIDDALRQYQLVVSERELIDQTLNGAVEVLTELMATSSPHAFARTGRVRGLLDALAPSVDPADRAELRLAGMLSQIGLVAVPASIVLSVARGHELTEAEADLLAEHPRLAQEMLRRIPRLERVAEWVGAQVTDVDDARPPEGPVQAGPDGYRGEVVFAAALAFLTGWDADRTPSDLRTLLVQAGFPDRLVLAVGGAAMGLDANRLVRMVTASELLTGMVLNQDVLTNGGMTLLRSGELVTGSLAIRLRHFAATIGIVEPISVLVDRSY